MRIPDTAPRLIRRRYDIRSLAVACAASGAIPLLVIALAVPSLVRPYGLWVLIVVSVFTVITVAVTVRVGVLDDRQFVVLGSGGMVGVAVSAFVITDPATTMVVAAMLGVVPAIAASGSSRTVTVSLAAAAIVLAVAVCIDETAGAVRWVAMGASVTTVLVPTVLMASLRSSVTVMTARLAQLAHTDPLTGLLNRRGLTARAAAVLDSACSAGVPLMACLVDIDHFKSVNDEFGHSAGDAVLVAVADTLRCATGPAALVARMGGEEFLVFGLGPDLSGAERVILESVRALSTAAADVTVSVGVVRCTVIPGEGLRREVTPAVDAVTTMADRALYEAKNFGRDQAAYALAAPLTWPGSPTPDGRP